MARVKFKIARGVQAKLKREGVTIVDHPELYYYKVRKKSEPKIVENNIQFGKNSKGASEAYEVLSDEERRELRERMEKSGVYTNVWHLFLKEYFNN